MNSRVSVVVPYKPGDEWRDKAWGWVARRWSFLLPGAEVVTGEPDLPFDDPGGFNHAQAINRAVERSTGDVLVIAQGDTTHSQDGIARRVAMAETGAWTIPRLYRRLTQPATIVLLEEPERTEPHGTIDDETEFSWAGVVVMPRAAFDAVGGCDERFDGWSPDDTAFGISVDTMYGPHQRVGVVYHLWHPQPVAHRYGREGFEEARHLSNRYTSAAGDQAAMRLLIDEREPRRS